MRILPIHSSFFSYPGRQFATTLVPFTASRRQIAVPIPPMPPVTNATRSVIQHFLPHQRTRRVYVRNRARAHPARGSRPVSLGVTERGATTPRARRRQEARCPWQRTSQSTFDGERYTHPAADAQTREALLG